MFSSPNCLYYGDNLDVLRRYVPDASVDLVYLDPPFKSNQNYNILFGDQDGHQSTAQIKAFEDTWHWDLHAEETFVDLIERGGQLSETMQAFQRILGHGDMLAYLTMMAPRLSELKRVLKPSGSIYLHCDPTASHYLKLLMDAVFGPKSFRTEIVWKRTSAHSDTKQGRKQHGRIHDVLFYYTKGEDWTWNPVYTPYDREYVEHFYKRKDEDGRKFTLSDLTANRPGGNTDYVWRGVRPYRGRYWAYSKANMTNFEEKGKLYYTRTGMPRLKNYLDEMPGVSLQDFWTDVKPIGSRAAERLGYPTQKPLALLERIIEASSNEGDVVLDPFCGCGTSVDAAEHLGRRWIGIDITHLAINLIRHRLRDKHGDQILDDVDVIGEPVTVEEAHALAGQDKHQFEWWTLGLVGARPADPKKGADRGIDGRLYFHDDAQARRRHNQIIISVKGGKVSVPMLRDLRGVVDREKAKIGVLISMKAPTAAMRKEAATAGFYETPWGKHPRLQLLTIKDLLDGKRIDCPPSRLTHRRARPKDRKADQMEIDRFA